MLPNRSIPQCTVIPEIAYPNIGEAVEWLCDAFGFTPRLRIADHRAQLNVGSGAVVLTELRASAERPSEGVVQPGRVDHAHSVMVRVENVDAHYERARRYGARVLGPPIEYPFGERQYGVEDFAGHRWTFSQSVADIDPVTWGGIPGELQPLAG